ncbi:MAG: LPS export ABC transporter periplasmic protein LptC [Gemmatimonadota bacterium]
MRRVLVLAVLTASALAACRQENKATVSSVATIADSADQVMFGLKTILTDRGVARAELQADTAYWFDENTRAELRVINTTFFAKDGTRDGVLTARRGSFNTRANVMEARQNVVIVGADGRKLTSPMVRFEQFRNMIVSDSPFVLLEGERRLEGVGFESDPQMLSVKVRKLSRGTGASIVLPRSGSSEPGFRGDPPAPTPPVLPPAGAPAPPKVKQ